jgi:hypothetical protein
MEHILKAMETVVDRSVGMDPRMARQFRSLIREGRQLEVDAVKAYAEERAKIDNAVLPECATFVGTGSRCGSCRILKKIHD